MTKTASFLSKPVYSINKTFKKRKNLLTLRHSQKHYEISTTTFCEKNITRKQLRVETLEIAWFKVGSVPGLYFRDFISHSLHSVLAWFAIGDFCLPCSREKRCYNWPFRQIYIWIIMFKGFRRAPRFYFLPRKLNHCFWRGKHDLIYHRRGIPVNMLLLSPSALSMADARHNTLFSALNIPFRLQNHLLFCSDTKI